MLVGRKSNRKKSTRQQAQAEPSVVLSVDYHQRAFYLFHRELERRHGCSPAHPHPQRKSYWSLVLPGRYKGERAQQYLSVVERELGRALAEQSIIYWLHIYRRLLPGAIGQDKQNITTGLTRAAFEAAIQRYGKPVPSERLASFSTAGLAAVFRGLLLSKEFEIERKCLQERDQLVLTDFGVEELQQFYDLERLAYEIWRGTAALRSIAKGAVLSVDGSPDSFDEERTSELEQLIESHDRRLERSAIRGTATGMVFPSQAAAEPDGLVLLPQYNVQGLPVAVMGALLLQDRIIMNPTMLPNFLWTPFDLRAYYRSHLAFAEPFERTHGITLAAVLVIIAALSLNVLRSLEGGGPDRFTHFMQRGYKGPIKREILKDLVKSLLPDAERILSGEPMELSGDEIERAFVFWELGNQRNIDLQYSGPHAVFLPYGAEWLYVDYAWMRRRLYDLFHGVVVTDGNFKGDALEEVIRSGRASVLPTGKCKAYDGTERQFDGAFAAGDCLIAVECKAARRSIDVDRGKPEAIQKRWKLIDQALSKHDERALWLAERPKGRNYDATRFSWIIPVVVTPFVEFTPSLEPRYWLLPDLPRVITPTELEDALERGTLTGDCLNAVSV